MIEIEAIRTIVESIRFVREIDQTETGHIRFQTSLCYPDGAAIDVFLKKEDHLHPGFLLTDFGQTVSWLIGAQIKPWTSKRRMQMLDDIVQLYGACPLPISQMHS